MAGICLQEPRGGVWEARHRGLQLLKLPESLNQTLIEAEQFCRADLSLGLHLSKYMTSYDAARTCTKLRASRSKHALCRCQQPASAAAVWPGGSRQPANTDVPQHASRDAVYAMRTQSKACQLSLAPQAVSQGYPWLSCGECHTLLVCTARWKIP